MLKRTVLALVLMSATAAVLQPEIFYPWKDTYIGALDAAGWPGLVIAPAKDRAFAFLLRVEREGEAAEGGDFYYLVSQVGPHSPDGLYARVRFDLGLPFRMGRDTPILMKPPPRKTTLTVEWSRRDETTVIGRILCPPDVRVTIVHYFPWDLEGEYALLPDGQVRGRSGVSPAFHYVIWTSRWLALTFGEDLVQVGAQHLRADDGKMDSGQERNSARFFGRGAQDKCPGFGQKVIGFGDAEIAERHVVFACVRQGIGGRGNQINTQVAEDTFETELFK